MGLRDVLRTAAVRTLRWATPGGRIVNQSPENPATDLADPASWLIDWAHGGQPSVFGPHVSERSSMAVGAVYRCVAILSGIAAGLPLKIYKRGAGGLAREEAPDHPLASFLQVAPYPGRAMTAFSWRENWIVNEELWGNHFSIKRYDHGARIIGFEPVLPWDVEVYRIKFRNIYRCVLWDSSFGPVAEGVTQRIEWVDQDDMIHIPGLGFNGVSGLSRIRAFARDAVSLSKLFEEQTGRMHENAAKPSGLITVPPRISPDGLKKFMAQFEQDHVGRVNAGKPIFADVGSTWTQLQIPAEDLGTIENRRFQVADISRFFGVPLHLLNETDKATSWGTGLSEQTLALLIYTVDPMLGRSEAELNYKLFAGTDYYCEFDRDALMAMDPLKAAQVAAAEIACGTLLINERRRHKNRPPVANGDQPLINSTNVPLAKIFAAAAQPAQDPASGGAPVAPDPLAPGPDAPAPDEDTEGN
jgi:HK97 family phage portal protein